MSLYDYNAAREIRRSEPPFAALIMAALYKADTDNAAILRAAFPEICEECQARYDAPGGVLPSDPEHEAMAHVERTRGDEHG